MLGLAASHLSLCSEGDYSAQALTHRIQAIAALNETLNRPCPTRVDADARFAAIMALAFQSSYMREGMLEFVSMIRGCVIFSDPPMLNLEESAFQSFSQENHANTIQTLFENNVLDGSDNPLLIAAAQSLSHLGLICQNNTEVQYLAILQRILRTTKVSYVNGKLSGSFPCSYKLLIYVSLC